MNRFIPENIDETLGPLKALDFAAQIDKHGEPNWEIFRYNIEEIRPVANLFPF
jgi:hypothetical protein